MAECVSENQTFDAPRCNTRGSSSQSAPSSDSASSYGVGAAKAWRQESQVALRRGTLRAPSPTTLTDAAEEWLQAAQAGVVRTRSGDRYKPSALRSYRQVLQACVLPQLGRQKLTAIMTR